MCRDITVNDDLICEADETILVSLTTAEDPSEVQLSPPSATVTIIDNDGRSLYVSPGCRSCPAMCTKFVSSGQGTCHLVPTNMITGAHIHVARGCSYQLVLGEVC